MRGFRERYLVAALIDEALDQSSPSKGLKRALLNYQNFCEAKVLREKALAAARQRKYRAKPDPLLAAISQRHKQRLGVWQK